MLEDKIEKMKKEQNLLQEDDKEIKRINTSIDLDIESYIPDDFFSSELDKINFYREIESIRSLEDLSSLISDFNEINEKIPKSVNNLFDLIKLKIISFKYNILKIKKI
ncbi:MAG: hypothetical protein P1U46_02490 [Patescibacteria group bacterium]|nr:hypothetical protein [Patescibacteria group bacterium]